MARDETPGLQWRTRKSGQRVAYWFARSDLVKEGYRPKSVRLHYDPSDQRQMDALRSRCQTLQAEMLTWSSRGRRRLTSYDGMLSTLVQLYETDEDSSYRDLHPTTAKTYSRILRILMRKVGDARIRNLNGADIRRWFRNISEASGERKFGYAALTISIFKSVLSYGANSGYDDCSRLRGQLSIARFRHAPARREFLSYQQVVAFREAAHRLSRPSAALWLTLQYELGMRRRDVIGEWIDDEATAGIRSGKRLWRDGLTWSHIDSNGVLRKVVSKTAKSTAREAEHLISDYPDLVVELERIPRERRVGPIVINETTGLPYTAEQCRHYFRLIAREAGIPDRIWNMDARAGAVTEAYEAGATTEGAMAMAAHTQASTSRRYIRETLEQTSRVARLRVKGRTERKPE